MSERSGNEKGKRIGNRLKFFLSCFVWMILTCRPVYASAGEPGIVSGTRQLLAAGTGLLTGLVAAVGIWKASAVGIQWINASPEERPKFQKELVTVIIAVVVTLTIGGTITWIVGFYHA